MDTNRMIIDITYDFRNDSHGEDPDAYSATLKAYQRFLYSRELPNGETMSLDEDLRWKDFWFSNDSILHGFCYWKSYRHIISQVDPAVIQRFNAEDYTIGGEIIFPCNRVAGVQTINQARGTSVKVRDRIDLTLECIRRYYKGEESPLSKCLRAYASFFDLFVDFKGYVDFFYLNDLVEADYSAVRYLTWFDGFESNYPLPRTVEEYVEYIDRVLEFNKRRNLRIKEAAEHRS